MDGARPVANQTVNPVCDQLAGTIGAVHRPAQDHVRHGAQLPGGPPVQQAFVDRDPGQPGSRDASAESSEISARAD